MRTGEHLTVSKDFKVKVLSFFFFLFFFQTEVALVSENFFTGCKTETI